MSPAAIVVQPARRRLPLAAALHAASPPSALGGSASALVGRVRRGESEENGARRWRQYYSRYALARAARYNCDWTLLASRSDPLPENVVPVRRKAAWGGARSAGALQLGSGGAGRGRGPGGARTPRYQPVESVPDARSVDDVVHRGRARRDRPY